MGFGELWEKYGDVESEPPKPAAQSREDHAAKPDTESPSFENGSKSGSRRRSDRDGSVRTRTNRVLPTDTGTYSQKPASPGTEVHPHSNTPAETKTVPPTDTSFGEQKGAAVAGVFEPDPGYDDGTVNRQRKSSQRHDGSGSNLSGIKDWPWVDIIGIALTVCMVVGILLNFEWITTMLFEQLLLPLLYNGFLLLVLLGIVLIIVWILRRPRGPRGRW